MSESSFRYRPKNLYQETTWRRVIQFRLAIFGIVHELCIRCVVNKNNSQGEMKETAFPYQTS